MENTLFWILALMTSLSAVGVLITQNIVRAAIWLLFTLAGTSGLFFLLGADFVGATQLIIYVGGILVLVVFGVMLTAQGPFITLRVSPAEWVIAVLVGFLLLGVLVSSIVQTAWPHPSAIQAADAGKSASAAHLGLAFSGIRHMVPDLPMSGFPNPPPRTPVGYLLPFEIVSVHLLVVLVGAAYLARAKRRKGAAS